VKVLETVSGLGAVDWAPSLKLILGPRSDVIKMGLPCLEVKV